jgi:hypothetical protein
MVNNKSLLGLDFNLYFNNTIKKGIKIGSALTLATLVGVDLYNNTSIERFEHEKSVNVYWNPDAKEVSRGLELRIYDKKFYPFGIETQFYGVPIAIKTDNYGNPLKFSDKGTLKGTVSFDSEYGKIITAEDGSKYRILGVEDSTYLGKIN